MEKAPLGPLVSVIIPAHNAEKYIADTIRSVTGQTYLNIEIIVINDGSTDGTKDIIDQLIIDTDIQVIHQENKGASVARNAGYARSTGSYIKFLDADDLISPGMIEQQVALAITHKNCIISGQWGRFYNDDINTFKLSPELCWSTLPPFEWICASWKEVNPMTNPGIFLIPKTGIEKAGDWNEELSLLDDTEYFTRTILACSKVIFCKDSTLCYRSGIADNLSGAHAIQHIVSAFKAVQQTTAYIITAKNDESTRLLCANIWQSFIYWIYPENMELINKAKQYVKQYGGADLKFKTGRYSKLLQHLIGWKLTKRMIILWK